MSIFPSIFLLQRSSWEKKGEGDNEYHANNKDINFTYAGFLFHYGVLVKM